jgi:Protein of unknown function (DUF669)
MAVLGGVFDATTVEPQGDYTPIAPGEYKVQIIASEMVATASGNGQMLKLEIEIVEGEEAGRKLFDRLNLINPNDKAVEIATRTLSAICHAVGVLAVEDSEQLHFKPMIAVVKVDPPRTVGDKEYGASNGIKTYKPLTAAGAAQATEPAKASPFAAKPAASAGSAPWKKAAAA